MTITAEEIGRLVTMDVDGLAQYMNEVLSPNSMMETSKRMGAAAAQGVPVELTDEENTSLVRFMIVVQRLVPLLMDELGASNEDVPSLQAQFEDMLNQASEQSGKPVSELRSIFFPQEGA